MNDAPRTHGEPDMETELKPFPAEYRRRFVQLASEMSCAVSPTPTGKAFVASLEAALVAMDAYCAESKVASPPA
jgi:hypothetical protein